ncbi:MAG: hypothetical protein Q9168_005650 [Polycauliona sp. 1 TL-2023]
MFGRSQSGPGGLSINTNQANSLSAPTTSQPAASGGLFGSSLQKEKPSTSLFGASLSNSQPQQSTSLFGSANPQSTQSTGLFGSTPAGQPQQGTNPSGPSTSNQAGGLFGTANMNTQQQSGGGIFGSQQQSSQPSLGLFGNTSTQPQSTTNMFGNTNAQPSSQQGSSIFGSLGQTQPQSKPQTLSVFNTLNQSSSNPPQNQAQQPVQQPSLFATSIGQFTQRQQPVPGVRVTTSELRPTTRFTDLHEQLQTLVENIDGFIQQQMKYQQECTAMNHGLDENCNQVPADVDFCTRALNTMQHALENDAEAISQAKALTKADVANAKLSFATIENMAVPQQYQATNLWALPSISREAAPSSLDDESIVDGNGSTSLVSFFSSQSDEMSKSLDNYKKNIGEVESYLKGIEVNTVTQLQQLSLTRGQDGHGKSAEDQVRELAAVLKDFEQGIIGIAGKVGGVREKVQEVVLDDSGSYNGGNRRFAL